MIEVFVAVALISFAFIFFILRRDSRGMKLPPGSLGLPIIGESLSFLKAQRDDRGSEWINERVALYGHVFKTSILGSPTAVIIGKEGNKFVFMDDEALDGNQPESSKKIFGKNSIFGLMGDRHKLVKGAMMSFLKPQNLQEYIGIMDDLVKTGLLAEMKEKDAIKIVPFMKDLMFNITCTLLFGLYDEHTKAALFEDFSEAMQASWSIPINFPGTIFWRGVKARSRIVERMAPIVRRRKEMLVAGTVRPKSDVISSMVALRDEKGESISDDEIMDNIISLVFASHDTTAILLSLMVWKLARDPKIHQKVLQEHMEILKERQTPEGKLTWREVQKMNYTWRVAQELMRLIPPVFGSFRKAIKDTSFGGYDIPKGWQVLWVCPPTHMDKDIFEDPDEFDPSRFQNPSKPIPPFAYIPFGAGVHMCIGNEFARVETLTIVHHMITNFEWSQLIPDEPITRQPMPYPSMGLPIKIKARNPSDFISDATRFS
ncbi:taxadiene 5-alpha hydroxylase-like [Magnolia sinica]|uniref:taxadiene 5-alpha hydroxylase-like n=1 Tax=Magnolia sinica TaxID=86752 RepID=UPI0026589638|nr:taxadiene 5-alpha hydroxylase-like [Magnolia sinica]